MSTLTTRSVLEHCVALERGEYSSVELTNAYLDVIEAQDKMIGAFLFVDREGALRAARESDLRRASGALRGKIDGIPYAVKDNFCTCGMPTTCASRMLKNFLPPYDATVVEKLSAAGCVLLGKLNMDEFAMGSSNEHSAFGVVRNPHDPALVAGGSSGGSAAAVAAGEVPFAIGSDTGGSVRQPASFCGTLGLKPTSGVISRYGMIALASSLDCVGILAQSAEDATLVLSAIAGKDPKDATSRESCFDSEGLSDLSVGRLRVAWVQNLCERDAAEPCVIDAIWQAIEAFSKGGARVEPVVLPSPELALASYCVISAAEASSNMARFDGVRYGDRVTDSTDLFDLYAQSRAAGLGDEVKRRILFGAYMLSEENRPRFYDRAVVARDMIRKQMLDLFERYDLVLSPVSPTPAFHIGSSLTADQKRRADLCAVYASLAGLPAVSVPYGKTNGGLPLSVQLTSSPLSEKLLLKAARFLEKGGMNHAERSL